MSLIHQVLQDLDGRPELQVGEVIGYAEEQKTQHLVVWPAIVVLFVCAALVIYFSEFIGGIGSTIATSTVPMNPVVESSFNPPDSSRAIDFVATNELPDLLQIEPVLELSIEPERLSPELVLSEGISPEILFQPVVEAVTLPEKLVKAEVPTVIVERNSAAVSQQSVSKLSLIHI